MKELVGIDIKSDYIKIVQLRKIHNGLKLARAAVVQTPRDAIGNNFIIDSEKISYVISKTFRDYGIRASNVAIAISDRTLMLQISKYPYMQKQEMIEVIKTESEQYSHFSGKEILVDYYVLNEMTEGNIKKLNILWAALLKDTISALSRAIYSATIIRSFNTSATLKFLYCEPTCFAFLRSLKKIIINSSLTNKDVVICIVFNDTTTDIIALQGINSIIFIRSINIGRLDFEKSIKPGEDLTLLNPIPTALANLALELQRSLSFIAKQIPVDVNIKGAYLGGSIHFLNKISELLTRELKITVEIHNPLEGIIIDKEFFSSIFLEQFGNSLAPAIGLALKEDNKVEINFVPAKEPVSVALEQLKSITLPFIVLIILIFLCINIFISIKISQIKTAINSSTKQSKMFITQVNKLDDIKKGKTKEEEKIKALEEFKKTGTGLLWFELINAAGKIASNSVWINKFDVTATKVIAISGFSLSHVSVSDFMSELNKSTYFRDFNLIEIQNTTVNENPAVKFTVSGYLK